MDDSGSVQDTAADAQRRWLLKAGAVAVLIACVWSVWALAVLPEQRAAAERAYFDEMRSYGDVPSSWSRPVEIQSAHARPVSLFNLIPPGFTFEVSVEASIGGEPRRDVGRVHFAGNFMAVEDVSFGDESLIQDTPNP